MLTTCGVERGYTLDVRETTSRGGVRLLTCLTYGGGVRSTLVSLPVSTLIIARLSPLVVAIMFRYRLKPITGRGGWYRPMTDPLDRFLQQAINRHATRSDSSITPTAIRPSNNTEENARITVRGCRRVREIVELYCTFQVELTVFAGVPLETFADRLTLVAV